MENSEALVELTKAHLEHLKAFNENETNPQLKEYFQYLSNSIDSRENLKFEIKKLNQVKANEKVIEQQKNKNFDINWNLEYCEYCKLSYWPSNCTVYISPKYRLNHKHAKLNTKYKLFDYKPKYKSYKDRLIKNVLNKGIELIYECKRCKSKNVIINELKRQNLKTLKLNESLNEKKFKQDLKKSKFKFNSKFENIKKSEKIEPPVLVKAKNSAIKKKFLSLQMKLKQSELEQEKIRNQTKNSFGSLADFLEKLS